MNESFSSEHRGEGVTDTNKEVLHGGGVTQKGGGHVDSGVRDVADGGFDVVGDPRGREVSGRGRGEKRRRKKKKEKRRKKKIPFDELGGLLLLDLGHVSLDILGSHFTTENSSGGQISPVGCVTK